MKVLEKSSVSSHKPTAGFASLVLPAIQAYPPDRYGRYPTSDM